MPDQKVKGSDKIQGFWLKSVKAMHEGLNAALNEYIEMEVVPRWLVNGNYISHYRPKY